jgi:hypothetical protein
MSERIPELLAGTLSEADARELRDHLASCAGCADEAQAMERLWLGLGELPDEEPPADLGRRFAARLAQEIAAEQKTTRSRVVPFVRREVGGHRFAFSGPFTAIAASVALVVVGVLAGAQLSSRNDSAEMAKLQQEVRSLHETVALALLSEPSAAKRMEGVAYGREASIYEDKVAAALFDALTNDPNVNVRLAALDALRPRAARPDERPRLVAAVAKQESPLVQLSLLSLLLESDGPAVRRDLQQLLDNPNLDPVVRGYLRDQLGRSL